MRVLLDLDGVEHEVYVTRADGTLHVTVDGEAHEAKLGERGTVTIGGRSYQIQIEDDAVVVEGHRVPFRIHDVKTGAAAGEPGGARGARVKPPMPGKIVNVAVNEGDEVKSGQVLLILEAMKMQNEITSPASGVVKKVHVKAGQTVEGKDVLVEIE